MSPMVTRLLNPAAMAYALGAPAVLAVTNWGLTAEQFSDPGDETLRAAGYAFSIWGLIYAGLAVQAGFHLVAGRRHEGFAVATALTAAVVLGGVSALYAAPVAWGLIAVFVAERGDQPVVAYAALAAAVLVVVSGSFAAGRRRGANFN